MSIVLAYINRMKLILAHRLFLAGMLLAGMIPCAAQQTMVLSKPADMSAERANNFLDNRSSRVNNDHNAPRSLFNNITPDVPLPPPQQFYQYQNPSVQEALNKRKNWTLLTPEEILGVQTAEQIMGVPADKTKPKLSLEEKFLLRQQSGATNGKVASLFSKEDNNPFSQKRDDRNSPFYSGERQSGERLSPDSDRYFDQLKKMAAQDAFAVKAKKEDSPWASGFANPTAMKRTPEQIAAMERFRAMLEPATPQPAASAIRVSAPAPDPYLQPQPKINPVGRSVESLENNSARPTGITPLPTVTGSAPKTQTKRPDWQAQPPPWTSGKPQTIEQKRANFY